MDKMSKAEIEAFGSHMVPGNPISLKALARQAGTTLSRASVFKRIMEREGLVTSRMKMGGGTGSVLLTLHKTPVPEDQRTVITRNRKRATNGAAFDQDRVAKLVVSRGKVVEQMARLTEKLDKINSELAKELGVGKR